MLIRVLLVGDFEGADFAGVLRRLTTDAARAECQLSETSNCESARAEFRRLGENGEAPPDVMLIAQHRPGELDVAAVDRLRRTAPLSAFVVVLGPWCEGEGRTGIPVPGVVRVTWHGFGPQWRRHVECWNADRCSPWQLPATMGDDERLLWGSHQRRLSCGESRSIAVVLGQSAGGCEPWLADLCRSLRWSLVSLEEGRTLCDDALVGIWQTDRLDAVALSELAEFSARLRPAPVIVVSGFPRPEHLRQIETAGATSLLAKPLAIDDLLAEVNCVLRERNSVAPLVEGS
jgi:hypothetical protein